MSLKNRLEAYDKMIEERGSKPPLYEWKTKQIPIYFNDWDEYLRNEMNDDDFDCEDWKVFKMFCELGDCRYEPGDGTDFEVRTNSP